MTVEIEALDLAKVLHVCRHMRQQDWEEVLNLLPKSITTPDVVAMVCMNVSKVGYVASIEGEPIGVIQVAEILDGTLRFGLFGTNRLPDVSLALCMKLMEIIPELIDDGAQYGEALADAQHIEAHKLLTFLGFRKTAILPEYGSHGADIALFTITRRQVDVLRNGGRWGKLHTHANASIARRDGGDRLAAGLPQTAD